MEATNYLLRDALDPRSEEGVGAGGKAGACEALKGHEGYKGAQGQKEEGKEECTEVSAEGLNRGLDGEANGEGTQVPAKQESAAMSA